MSKFISSKQRKILNFLNLKIAFLFNVRNCARLFSPVLDCLREIVLRYGEYKLDVEETAVLLVADCRGGNVEKSDVSKTIGVYSIEGFETFLRYVGNRHIDILGKSYSVKKLALAFFQVRSNEINFELPTSLRGCYTKYAKVLKLFLGQDCKELNSLISGDFSTEIFKTLSSYDAEKVEKKERLENIQDDIADGRLVC